MDERSNLVEEKVEGKLNEVAGTEVQEKDAQGRGEPADSNKIDTAEKDIINPGNAVPTPAGEAAAAAPPTSKGEPVLQESVRPQDAPVSTPNVAEPLPAAAKENQSVLQEPSAPSTLPVVPPNDTIKDEEKPGAAIKEDNIPVSTPAAVQQPSDLPSKIEEPKTETVKPEEKPSVEAIASALKVEDARQPVAQLPKAEQPFTQSPAGGQPVAPLPAAVVALEKKVETAELNALEAKQEAQEANVKAAVLASGAPLNLSTGPQVLPNQGLPIQTGLPPQGLLAAQAQQARMNPMMNPVAMQAQNLDMARRQEALVQFQAQQAAEERERQQRARDSDRPSQPSYLQEENPAQERNPPRAASAKAAQNFRKDQDDYLSESPHPSQPGSPQKKATEQGPPKPKPPTPPAAKPTQSKDSGADAWEEPPQKQLVLKMADITKALQKKWLQLYWPDDGKWWPCQVVFVDPRKRTANVLYETGEEEADLGLAELVEKGEVAWLNPSDAKAAEAKNRPKMDEYDDPSTGRGRGRKPVYDDDDEDEEDDDDDDDGWGPNRKRKAAQKAKAKAAELSDYSAEPESESESESLPPSDQSSDWHSSEDEDKPKRRPKKKKRPMKPAPRMPAPSHHHHHTSQSRERHGMHGSSGLGGGSNMIGRGGIFDDGPSFGGSFGNEMRMQQQRNPSISREQMQPWGGMGANRSQNQLPGSWNRQSQGGLDHMLQQNRSQMNNGNMGQIHIPQVSGQGGRTMDILGYQQASQAMRTAPQMTWRPQASAELLGRGNQDWMQANSLLMRQMQQQQGQAGGNQNHMNQLLQQQMLQQQQQQLQQQRMAQHQSQQAGQGNDAATAQRPSVNLGSSTKNMETIVAQGLTVAGKMVEVQQANGTWAKGTIMACMTRGPQGGSAMVHFENGEQKQLSVNDEGRTYNIRMLQ